LEGETEVGILHQVMREFHVAHEGTQENLGPAPGQACENALLQIHQGQPLAQAYERHFQVYRMVPYGPCCPWGASRIRLQTTKRNQKLAKILLARQKYLHHAIAKRKTIDLCHDKHWKDQQQMALKETVLKGV